MALWLKQEDGTLVEVSGGGGGGSFDGEHVLTGDPDSPPEGWAVGQLLYDGLEDAADSSGPHDHDYLPLTGGTLTGNLIVDASVYAQGDYLVGQYHRASVYGTASWPCYSFSDEPNTGIYRAASGVVGVSGDLQVDGAVSVGSGRFLTFNGQWAGGRIYNTPSANREFMIIGDGASGAAVEIHGNNDSNASKRGKVNITGDLLVNGIGVSRFNVADGIDTRDVLERAETATMPVLDEEGVATAGADVESLSVNEVVTALLLKVKELSAEIKELKGN